MSEEQLLHQVRQATRGTPQEALQATTEAVHLPQAVQATAAAAAQATAEEVPAEDSAEAVRAEAEDHQEAEDKDNSKRRAQ